MGVVDSLCMERNCVAHTLLIEEALFNAAWLHCDDENIEKRN